jgi:acetyl-CoA carboxylase carboxyl transferase subunit alpha
VQGCIDIVPLKRSKKTTEVILPFEKPIFELEEEIAAAETEDERNELIAKRDSVQQAIFSKITPWERVQLARHPQRPRMRSFVEEVFEDFVELHGDRALGDDPAMVTGIARFNGETVFVVGQQKGVDTDEKVKCNFGMAHPEGYRKALRIYRMAERLKHPVICIVDTPAAHPGIEAEAHGQGYAIAYNLLESFKINVPILCVILSEGGSGGALAIAVGDRIAMCENAVYVICPPERCAEILWRDVEKREMAASALRVSAADLKSLGIIDSILAEPNGGAHRDFEGAAESLSSEISAFLDQARKGAWSIEARRERFQQMGQWLEQVSEPLESAEGSTPSADEAKSSVE